LRLTEQSICNEHERSGDANVAVSGTFFVTGPNQSGLKKPFFRAIACKRLRQIDGWTPCVRQSA
jgi:hypothetical protein